MDVEKYQPTRSLGLAAGSMLQLIAYKGSLSEHRSSSMDLGLILLITR